PPGPSTPMAPSRPRGSGPPPATEQMPRASLPLAEQVDGQPQPGDTDYHGYENPLHTHFPLRRTSSRAAKAASCSASWFSRPVTYSPGVADRPPAKRADT